MSNGISPPLTIGSTVDRTIHQTYPQSPTSTPSSKTCPPDIELLHRLNGTSILAQTTTLLRLSASAYATSTAIFHRFYHRQSLEEFDVWSTSMGCVILACKIEEEIKRVSEVILVFVHVYRRMRLAIDYSDDDGNGNDNENDSDDSINQMKKLFQTASCSLLQSKKLTQEERKNILRYVKPLPRTGPVYREWEEELLRTENVILRELGFSLYWIPESHPHVFLLYFMKVLELVDEGKDNDKDNDEVKTGHDIKVDEGNGKGIAQVAWNYCNDSCRLDFCVRYEPELIVSFDKYLPLFCYFSSSFYLCEIFIQILISAI